MQLLYLPVAIVLAATGAAAQSVEEMKLTVGKSIVLDYPADIRQISTSDPGIVDAIAVSTREILLHAKSNGTATVVVWARSGQRTIYSIGVEQNLEPLRRLLKETFPKEDIQVQASRDSLSLTGRVPGKEVGDRAVALAATFAKTVVNNLQLPALPVDKQILLRVKFAELNRTLGRAFGVNLLSTGAGGMFARTTTGQFAPPQAVTSKADLSISDALNIFAFRPDLNLAAFIKALQNEGVLQILAEPNLVTTNGKEASFLVGGEFPIPILQGSGNAGAVTIQFREFGIRLTFNPVVTENNTIKMMVKPEVSTIDLSNAVTLNGFLIPALATRRIETNIELGEGQSFVIGGLIDDRMTETMNKIPGLSAIPLLGTLFKSRDERKNRTELVVVVTPEITRPLQPGEVAPTPTMPREFLPPVAPGTEKSSIQGDVQASDSQSTVAQVDLSKKDKKEKSGSKKEKPSTAKEPKKG